MSGIAGEGFELPAWSITAYNRTGSTVAVGQIVQVDLGQDGSGVANNTPGEDDAGINSIVTPQSDQLKAGIFGIVTRAAAAGAKALVLLRGRYKGVTIVQAVSGTVAPGTALVPIATGSKLDADLAAGEKIIGLVMESVAAVDSSGKSAEVLFDGVSGFGNYLA